MKPSGSYWFFFWTAVRERRWIQSLQMEPKLMATFLFSHLSNPLLLKQSLCSAKICETKSMLRFQWLPVLHTPELGWKPSPGGWGRKGKMTHIKKQKCVRPSFLIEMGLKKGVPGAPAPCGTGPRCPGPPWRWASPPFHRGCRSGWRPGWRRSGPAGPGPGAGWTVR